MIFHSCLGLWTVAFGERLPEELLLLCLWSFSRGGFFCKTKRQLQKPSQRPRLLLPLLLWANAQLYERTLHLPPPQFSTEHPAYSATVAKTHPTSCLGAHFVPCLHLYTAGVWLETIPNSGKRLRVTSRIFKSTEKPTAIWRELIYKPEASLASSASGTWVHYTVLFGTELTVLLIPWRQINFASVPLCAQISCFLDFTPLIRPTNRSFLLSFLLQLHLYCSLHYFAQLRKTPKFHTSDDTAHLLGLFRRFPNRRTKHKKFTFCLSRLAAKFLTTVPSLQCVHSSLESDLYGNCRKSSEIHHLTQPHTEGPDCCYAAHHRNQCICVSSGSSPN